MYQAVSYSVSMPMITCDDCDENGSLVTKFFSMKASVGFHERCEWSAEKELERLVFQASRKPYFLEAHVERIYYCFQNHLDEPLLGALVDLLTVLRGKGSALGKRMILGSKSRFTEKQYTELLNHLGNKGSDISLLPDNRYSVFTKGLLSVTALLHHNKGSNEKVHDPLALAMDYIEFSQLDNAVYILEQAILSQAERMELHRELLSLYRSTRNVTGFNRMYETLSRKKIALPVEWLQLRDFFMQLTNDEK